MNRFPTVVIVGRANVGKSTLFNRLTSGAPAIVSDTAGTTRDSKENPCFWRGRQFTLVDTAGLDSVVYGHIEREVARITRRALKRANLILFVVDVKTGITAADQAIAKLLQTAKRTTLLVVNKTDGPRDRPDIVEWNRLGFGAPLPVSAATGVGTGDLLDEIVKRIPAAAPEAAAPIRVAIIGKPNVGKSSLVNALIGDERVIVHDTPYTTRDANDIHIKFGDTAVTLIDTAGVRKKSKIDRRSIEAQSVEQSMASIQRADVVLFVTDASQPITVQDKALSDTVSRSSAAVVVIANKWDLISDKSSNTITDYENYYAKILNRLSWAPVQFMSAKNKTKITQLKKIILAVYQEKFRTVDENALSKFLHWLVKRHKPTRGAGTNRPYIRRMVQEGVNPPQFVLHLDSKSNLHASYLNFIEKKLREKYGFEGTPIKLWIKKFKR